MGLASRLVALSAIVFAFVGVAYLVLPAQMLAVVGIASDRQSDFLMRTEGVTLASAAIFLWAARRGRAGQLRLVLIGLGVYYILGSAVDLAAFRDGIVGSAAVPSAVVRIALGAFGLVVAARLRANGGA